MTSNDKLFNIVAGPGKWDLLTAFGNAYGDINAGQTVELQYFTDNSRMKIHLRVKINGLEHESGSGDSWNFKGIAEMPNGRQEHIKGYYSSHGRNGHFKIGQ
jgi:hypothetical protein